MKSKFWLLLLVAALLGAAGGFLAARSRHAHPDQEPDERRVLYYQSPMHPWIKSDRPGNCTICGMKLTPIYEGEQGLETQAGVVALGTNIIQVLNVQTEAVQRRTLVRTLRVAGRIEENDTKHRIVSAYIDGRIDELAVNYVGAEVVAGEPLATFFSPELLTAEREYLTLLKQAQSNSAPGSGLDEQQQRLVAAAAQRLLRLGLDEAQIQALEKKDPFANHSVLPAPVSGTVVKRMVYEGQYVSEGDPLFEIADFSTMWFQFDVYEQDLAWIRPGQLVQVTTAALPGQVLSAPITFIDPNLDETTRSAKVRVELPNPLVEVNGRPRRLLYHRLYAEGLIHVQIPDVLAVPRTAILAPGPRAVAYVELETGTYEQREVRLGRVGDRYQEVLAGVAEGEKVVTNGNMLIDAQAQLNQGAGGHHHAPRDREPIPAPHDSHTQHQSLEFPPRNSTISPDQTTPPTPAQKEAAGKLFQAAADLAAALAADDLAAYNRAAADLHPVLQEVSGAYSGQSTWSALLEDLNTAGHLPAATDLKSARKAFFSFSAAVVEFARTLRKADPQAFGDVRLYRCPMTNQAFEGAPKTGFWLQLAPPLRNPFFGAEMLDCGTEVKP